MSERMGQSRQRWPGSALGHRVDGLALIRRFAVCGRWRQRLHKNVVVGVIAHKHRRPAAASEVTAAPAVARAPLCAEPLMSRLAQPSPKRVLRGEEGAARNGTTPDPSIRLAA